MLPKIAHVIIVGLSDEERSELDHNTRKMLHFSDPKWQYTSYGCATLRDAVEMAKGMERVDILYVAHESLADVTPSQNLEYDYALTKELMQNHPSKPVLSYANPALANKLAKAIFALWRDRSKTAK